MNSKVVLKRNDCMAEEATGLTEIQVQQQAGLKMNGGGDAVKDRTK